MNLTWIEPQEVPAEELPVPILSTVQTIDDAIAELTEARGYWIKWETAQDYEALKHYHHHAENARLAVEEAITGEVAS